MEKYIVISSHTVEDCQKVVIYFKEYHGGFLTNLYGDLTTMTIPPILLLKLKTMNIPGYQYLQYSEIKKVVKLTTVDPKETPDPLHE